MPIRFELKGAAEFAKLLDALPPRVAAQQRKAFLQAAAQPMLDRARELVPVAPGKPDIKDDIGIGRNDIGQDDKETAIAIGPGKQHSWYGSFVELGTAHQAAQPFMRPAFDTEYKASLDIMSDEIWFALKHGIDIF